MAARAKTEISALRAFTLDTSEGRPTTADRMVDHIVGNRDSMGLSRQEMQAHGPPLGKPRDAKTPRRRQLRPKASTSKAFPTHLGELY